MQAAAAAVEQLVQCNSLSYCEAIRCPQQQGPLGLLISRQLEGFAKHLAHAVVCCGKVQG